LTSKHDSLTPALIYEKLLAEYPAPVSGSLLGKDCRISRQAVAKVIAKLLDAGVEIEALHRHGYRLMQPDDRLDFMTPQSGSMIGSRIVFVSDTKSTNALATRLADEGAEQGTVVLADSQSGGRGRLGRHWHSPPGLNIHCSLILRPKVEPPRAPQLTLVAAVALAEALLDLYPLDFQIKWPNDLLVGGKKISGILTEMKTEQDLVDYVVIGIGLNCNLQQNDLPPEIEEIATSLSIELRETVSRRTICRKIFVSLEKWYVRFLSGDFAAVRTRWQELARIEGRAVTVSNLNGSVSGKALGLADDGTLLLCLPNGEITRIYGGDVTLEPDK
jgi:BirA family transcriptional regulator, biotin operon repressor / biotin---[acetyl-CoA-carboxylase] ligase